VTEPLPAILDGWEQPVTEIERAALAVDPHVSLSSHEPGEFGGTCPDCMAALRYIRRLRAAMEPVIEARVRVDVLRAAADEIERDGGSVLTALWAADALREKASETGEDQKRDEEQQRG
jgi:hypothetical protein